MQTYYLIALSQVVVLMVLLLMKPNKYRYDWTLMGWLGLFLIHTIGFYLHYTDNKALFWIVEFSGALVFLQGPILWIYIQQLTSDKKSSSTLFLHFIPFLVNIVFILVLNAEARCVFYLYVMHFKMLSMIVYYVLSIRYLFRLRKVFEKRFSNLESLQLSWLKYAAIGGLVFVFITVLSYALNYFQLVEIPMQGEISVQIAASTYILVVGVFGIKQQVIFKYHIHETLVESDIVDKPLNEKTEEVFTKLNEMVLKERLYEREELSIGELSEIVGIPAYTLSRAINENTGSHFFDYINKHRVNAFIEKLKRGEHKTKTLLGLALESGFNSKASFNRVFKNITQQTPSQFLKNL